MGNVRSGPPRELIAKLGREFNIDNFVETGTFYGDTAYWASNEFENVNTIELSDELHDHVTEKHGEVKNIDFIKGKSQQELSKVVQEIDTSAIFWLDAHYSGEGTAGQGYECPVLEEIEAIGKLEENSYILIDDARLFCSPPPKPHSAEEWPTISDVILKIYESLSDEYYVTITEDVIVAVPSTARTTVFNHAQNVATKRANRSKIEKGLRLIIQGVFDNLSTESNKNLLKKSGLYPVVRKIYYGLSTEN
jgi:hypothetical protein